MYSIRFSTFYWISGCLSAVQKKEEEEEKEEKEVAGGRKDAGKLVR